MAGVSDRIENPGTGVGVRAVVIVTDRATGCVDILKTCVAIVQVQDALHHHVDGVERGDLFRLAKTGAGVDTVAHVGVRLDDFDNLGGCFASHNSSPFYFDERT